MKKVFKFLIVIVILILIFFIGFYLRDNAPDKEVFNVGKEKLKLVVVGVADISSIYATTESGRLIEVTLNDLNSVKDYEKFKRGQEIEIYYDGVIATTYPGKISNVSKYKILKEKSEIEIPEEVIMYIDNSTENVMAHVREITNEKMEFRILDTNEIPYEYDFEYSLSKKNLENEEYNKNLTEEFKKEQGIDSASEKSNVATTNTTATNSTKPFNPDTSRYKTVWERVNEIEIVPIEDIIKIVDSTPGHFDMEGKISWNDVYGTLEQGEYKFILKNKGKSVHFNAIEFSFVVKEDGEVTCEVPEFGW